MKWIATNPNNTAILVLILFAATVAYFIRRSYKKTAELNGGGAWWFLIEKQKLDRSIVRTLVIFAIALVSFFGALAALVALHYRHPWYVYQRWHWDDTQSLVGYFLGASFLITAVAGLRYERLAKRRQVEFIDHYEG